MSLHEGNMSHFEWQQLAATAVEPNTSALTMQFLP
jgi:hypothetical protein